MKSEVITVAFLTTVAFLAMACTDPGTPTSMAADKIKRSEAECANTLELIHFCHEGSWEGPNSANTAGAGQSAAEIERGKALTQLYDRDKFRVIKEAFNAKDGTCKSIIKVAGRYNGSDYSATFYCDKTINFERRMIYLQEQAAKQK